MPKRTSTESPKSLLLVSSYVNGGLLSAGGQSTRPRRSRSSKRGRRSEGGSIGGSTQPRRYFLASRANPAHAYHASTIEISED
eukprot:4165881-Pyramimonas_sp.AAC.1